MKASSVHVELKVNVDGELSVKLLFLVSSNEMAKSTQRLSQIAEDPRCKRLSEVESVWKVSSILMAGVVIMALST